jgi:glucose-fructose oxidoreductase
MTSALLRFPDGQLAAFTSSFGASAVDWFEVTGTKGSLRLDNAYEYAHDRWWQLTIDEKTRNVRFKATDQFAPELLYFSDCVLQRKDPEPSGNEGLADVRIIQALYQSAEIGKPVSLDKASKESRPTISMTMKRPKVRHPQLIHATKASE